MLTWVMTATVPLTGPPKVPIAVMVAALTLLVQLISWKLLSKELP